MEKDFGKRLVQLRENIGMTQKELGNSIGISAQAISKWENGVTMPDILMLGILADVLSVDVNFLLGRVASTNINTQIDVNIKIIIDSGLGGCVELSLPYKVIKRRMNLSTILPNIQYVDKTTFVNLEEVIDLAESGALGKVIEVKSSQGPKVIVVIEENKKLW